MRMCVDMGGEVRSGLVFVCIDGGLDLDLFGEFVSLSNYTIRGIDWNAVCTVTTVVMCWAMAYISDQQKPGRRTFQTSEDHASGDADSGTGDLRDILLGLGEGLHSPISLCNRSG